jgi:hypothetical protein
LKKQSQHFGQYWLAVVVGSEKKAKPLWCGAACLWLTGFGKTKPAPEARG